MNFNLLVGIPPVGRNISLGGIITSDTFLSDNISATTFRKSTTGLGLITGSDQITHETGTGVKRHKNPLKNLKELIRDAYGDDGISRDSFGVTYIGNKFYAVDGTNISPLNTKETILKYSHPSIFGMAGEGKTSNLRRWQYHNNKEIEQYVMGLKGYDFDVNQGVWKPVSPPLLNDAGINFIKTMIRTVINKHSINTFLSADEAHKICLYHTEAFVKTLRYRKNVYNAHLADLTAIAIGFDNLAYIILSRSVEDKQRKHNSERMRMSYNGENKEGGPK
jgi:hypothetical protein